MTDNEQKTVALEMLANHQGLAVVEFIKKIESYSPGLAVYKLGNDWKIRQIFKNDFPGVFATKKEEITMAERHLNLYKDKLIDPVPYLSTSETIALRGAK